MVEQKAELLSKTALFKDVDRALLQELAERAELHTFKKKGQFVFYEGDRGGPLVVIASGLVRLVKTSKEGAQLVTDFVGPGRSCGEIAFVDGGRRTASAEVLQADTTVLRIPPEALPEILRSTPLAEALLRWFADRERAMSEIVEDLAFRDLHGRVAKLLVNAVGSEAQPGTVFSLEKPRRTQSDLAEAVGGSRQSVNQILQSFQTRGWIRLDAKGITLLRPDKLKERARL
jgi:CRP/FNR family transcriptional regulator, cyclic AMP receptor protein